MTGHLAILGPGVLGQSLAKHAAHQGLAVRLIGRDADRLRSVAESINATSPSVPVVASPSWTDALEGAEAVLEALPERLDLKAPALARLAAETSEATLLLTGSSGIPLADLRLAAGLARPLLGFHLFVPVRRMRVVELIQESDTPEPLRHRAEQLAERLGLKVCAVRDQAGYAATRMALVQGLEAMRLLEGGTARAESLDALMTQGYGHPCGPLELSDRIGLDLRLALAEQLHARTGDPRFEAPTLLRRLVAQGSLGRKSGQGFYAWNERGERS